MAAPDGRVGTCPVCSGRAREMRREPDRFLCDGCARYLTEDELRGEIET